MYFKKQYDDQNIGLPMRFQLTSSGSFRLIGGKEKVDDNVSMLLAFIGWFRMFTQDYIINAYKFLQNTTAYLVQFKNILRLNILDIGKRYVPFAKFYSVEIPLNYQNRKETTILIQFKYNLKNVNEYQVIKRLII